MSTPIIFDFDELFKRTQEISGRPPVTPKASQKTDRPMKMGKKGVLVFICATCDGSGLIQTVGGHTKFCDECTESSAGLGTRKFKDSYY